MPTILDEIVAAKRKEIAAARQRVSEDTLRDRIETAPAPRDFFGALAAGDTIRLIAEVKKASPSAQALAEIKQ